MVFVLFLAGIDSYNMDVSDSRWPDLTYDGVGSAKVMKNGLGQLTDGHVGNNDITSKLLYFLV